MAATILCLSYSGKKLGAAIYEEDIAVVKIVHDTSEEESFSILKSVLDEVKPDHVIVNKSQDANFLMAVRKLCNFSFSNMVAEENRIADASSYFAESEMVSGEQESSDAEFGARVQGNVETRQIEKFPGNRFGNRPTNNLARQMEADQTDESSERKESVIKPRTDEEELDVIQPALNFFPEIAFNFNEAKRKIEKLCDDRTHDARLLAAFRFDYTSVNMIRAIGALLRYLDQQRIGVEFEEYDVRTPIRSFNTLSLNELMEVDSVTQQALEIFYSDYNAQNIRRKFIFGNSRKEGMSIFKLCNICRSTPGKLLLRSWFERPTKSRDVLHNRQEGVSFFFHDCNLDAMNYIRNKMKAVMSVRGIIKRMERGNVSVTDWRNLYNTIVALVDIGDYLEGREIHLEILKEKMKCFGNDLKQIAQVLIDMVDFNESSNENRLVLINGVNSELDKLKETYERLPDTLFQVAKAECEELKVETCNVAYVPIIGYLLMIPEQFKVPNEAMVRMIFSAEGMCHYKTKRMENLDEDTGDIKLHIIDTETAITLRLQKLVLKRAGFIMRAMEAAAILDCLSSLAVVAREYNWTRPRFVGESVIEITMARHPIAELLCKSSVSYVPNPVLSSVNYSKLKILSGPNASGKSVYLKMVGAITYLAHVGSFVPAERATFGPINRIMSRIYTIDSVLDGMSSFANDLKQMSAAIRKSDANSLLIIDEFGKGTMTEVGLSLLASCLNYWLEKPSEECPHLFVASHFHALRNLLVQSDMILYQTMDVIRKEDDDLEFQFKLIDGVIDNSYASLTALKMGIPKSVVDRADEVYLHLRAGSSVAELEQKDQTEEERCIELASRMESMMDSFRTWDMAADPLGFLELAERTLLGAEKE